MGDPALDRHFVVGTAGHIDHGKTALVKALTGVDTDRWEEEKRRGITIDLGFAPLDLGSGLMASVVDVPGHEAFVRNMLAGATGIDLALLVIAADEGVMPQTEEHLAIVELLGVARGVPVITKVDLAEAAWLELVVEDLVARLARSRAQWSLPVLTSAATGAGLEELRAALVEAAVDLPDRPPDDLFRLPIDRVFALPGAGTVVTGTTWSGLVGKGDLVRILPRGLTARVRSLEVHGHPVDAARPGRRTALALLDVDRESLARGDVVVDAPEWLPTSRILGTLELLPGVRRPLRRRERVRVHLGTAAVTGWLVGPADLKPGSVLEPADLALERPIVTRSGDRFVLRGGSPVTTIGGGVVLDPYPASRARAATLAELVAAGGSQGVEVGHLPLRLRLRRGEVSVALGSLPSGIRRLGPRLVSDGAVHHLAGELVATVQGYHASHPLEAGMSLQALRAGAGAPGEVADAAIEQAVSSKLLVVEGPEVRRPDWSVAGDPRTAWVLERLASVVAGRRWHFPSVAELEADFGVETTRPLLGLLAREGRVIALNREHYIDRRALEEFEVALRGAMAELGTASPAQLRDAVGLTRKHLIPLLEWADRQGLTRREGDGRKLAVR